jgi:hypothetical protein
VVLVGHSGAGKTTLVEALLMATGGIQRPGRVEDGTTVSDFDEVEIRQQRSVNLTLAPLAHAGIKVNLLDTVRRPGDRRRGRPDPDALGGMRCRRHAPGGRHHQDRSPARRLRAGPVRVPAGVR